MTLLNTASRPRKVRRVTAPLHGTSVVGLIDQAAGIHACHSVAAGRPSSPHAAVHAASRHEVAKDLVARLPACTHSESELVAWVGQLADLQWEMSFDQESVATQFEAVGYRRNDLVTVDGPLTSAIEMARWIIGQAIDQLRRGYGVPPVLSAHAAMYAAMNAAPMCREGV